MIGEVIRVSMNVTEFAVVVGAAFAIGFFLGLWVRG